MVMGTGLQSCSHLNYTTKGAEDSNPLRDIRPQFMPMDYDIDCLCVSHRALFLL